MFQRVLVAIDTSPLAGEVLDAAAEVALKFGAEVLVAHIREVELPMSMARASGIPRPPRLESEPVAGRLAKDAVERLKAAGITARSEIGPGSGATARDILAVAAIYRPDLIVIGRHGSHVTELLLGTVAHKIVHLAPCPVLVIR